LNSGIDQNKSGIEKRDWHALRASTLQLSQRCTLLGENFWFYAKSSSAGGDN